ncbi:MAG: glutathione S-transferase [Paracoccaceae bacterium]
MKLSLFIGDRAYSSWSLRGWLLLEAFGIPFRTHLAHMRTQAFEDLRAEIAPSLTVPALRVSPEDGSPWLVWDSIAMAETLAELFPDAGLWPLDPAKRAAARSVTAEMHSGFTALRGACPMNMRRAYAEFPVTAEIQTDLDRLSLIWGHARALSDGGPFLFGDFCAADAFFAPVASRIATYGLPMGSADAEYVAAVLGHPAVRQWRALGMADAHIQAHYEFDFAARANPHEPALTGTVVPGLTPENTECPYSGKPVHPDCVVQIGARAIGYCNPGCAAKTAADPMAWPKTVALLDF